jgi:hypothetical protein
MFRGWRFLPKFWDFRGVRSSESTRFPEGLVLGNSGKHVTLETSGVMKFVKWVFRNVKPAKPRSRELAKIGNLEHAKLWSRELAKIWNLEPAKLRSRELAISGISNLRSSEVANLRRSGVLNLRSSGVANLWRSEALNLQSSYGREPVKTRSHEPVRSWNRESVDFENPLKSEFGSHGVWRFPEWGDSQTSKKPSERRCLKKSGFGVWTSGKLVNVWDVKDIHVCVDIGNIPWIRGYFRNVKVPSSPYKRGRKGTCKRIHNFWGLSSF